MIGFKQVITNANTEYIYSIDIAVLDSALASLEEILANPALNENNRANAEALRMRLACKIFAVKCITEFDASVEDKLKSFVEENLPVAKEKGYNKSAAVLEKTLDVVSLFCSRIKAKKEISAHCQSDALLASKGRDILKSAAELVKDITENITSPFGEDVAFPTVSGEFAESLESWLNGVRGAYAKSLERTVAAKKINYREYSYYPMPEYDEGGKANTLILNTPFADEARLYAAFAVPKDVELYEFNINAAGGAKEGSDKIFGYAEYKRCAVFISGTELAAEDDLKYMLCAAMRAGKSGLSVFILDTSGGSLYDAAMTAALSDETLSALDISSTYISMPSFDATVKELVALKMAEDAEAREALKEMPFLGFMGLNEIVRPEYTNNWMTRGKKISAANAAAAKKYLSKIKAAYQFIDDGWGDFKCGGTVEQILEFDYDGIPELDVGNIRKIVESNATVFGKCGMVARYCTTGTGDVSIWGRMEREEMESRVTLAVKMVYRILGVPINPEVAILDKLENDTAGGLCCDGGKRIEFLFSSCKNISWMRDCIVHECFHSLQSKLTGGNWAQWYYDNMGISYGRVCRWKETRQIYNHNTHSDVYKVHMYEADANAFEIDCQRGLDAYWSTIDFS